MTPAPESVWDYPRPPRLERSSQRIRVIFNQILIADSQATWRILETSHPPVYYIPPHDLQMQYFCRTQKMTYCEFKGVASYWTIRVGEQESKDAAWSYVQPTAGYEAISEHLAVYPSRMDRCLVDEEVVQAQAGDFYGGWITANITGPFKGVVGTAGW